MLNRIIRSSLVALFLWLAGIHLARAGIIPNPETSPTPTIPPAIDQPPSPSPTITPPPLASPTITPPPVSSPTPTVPTVTPPPVSTPTVPPVNPPPVSTPTIPPVNPPPVSTPTIPPAPNANALAKADPQIARAVVYYGQNGTIPLLNDRGRFQKVALLADEVIRILVTLSPLDYGKPAAIELLDGGSMSTAVTVPKPADILPTATISPVPSPTINAALNSDSSSTPGPTALPVYTVPPTPDPSTLLDTGALVTVPQTGEIVFAFKPGSDAGRHRISVIVGGNQYYLQFWRQDPSAPNNNQRMPHAY